MTAKKLRLCIKTYAVYLLENWIFKILMFHGVRTMWIRMNSFVQINFTYAFKKIICQQLNMYWYSLFCFLIFGAKWTFYICLNNYDGTLHFFYFASGTSEAFLHAVATENQLKRSNDSLLVFSLIYLVLNVLLMRSAGAVGLILANSISILYNKWVSYLITSIFSCFLGLIMKSHLNLKNISVLALVPKSNYF